MGKIYAYKKITLVYDNVRYRATRESVNEKVTRLIAPLELAKAYYKTTGEVLEQINNIPVIFVEPETIGRIDKGLEVDPDPVALDEDFFEDRIDRQEGMEDSEDNIDDDDYYDDYDDIDGGKF